MNSCIQTTGHGLVAKPLDVVRVIVWLGVIGLISAGNPVISEETPPEILQARGQQIYELQCARCHGDQGQGNVDFYPDPLIGDASIGELTEIISETMPEEDPDTCVAEDADAVARFIHEAFYSEAAQLRNRPPSIQFSRLTSSQLRQSLADLYQHFHRTHARDDRMGLSGTYFNSNRWKKEELKFQRIDPVVDFDFRRESPGKDIKAEEFYIYWEGSLQPAHTGRYEIVVESTCSMKVKFGHRERILIDNHVQSEGKTEFRRTLQLIGGRQYPIYIDFTQRKRKTEQPPARFSLRWVPPGGTEQVIPPEYLLPSTGPSTFALQTKLPPDDRTYGYDRGTRVDRQWDEAVTSAALEFGDRAGKELWPHYR
ncbi:MAG: PA14 domain-containing protein, partial [Planctomycetota bacterium]